jgi:phosphoribosylanthranilate isomerase
MSYSVRVKICGVTAPEAGLLAAACGADTVGLNFYEPSPRYVDLTTAERILRELPPFVEPVGVFVNQSLDQVLLHTINPLSERIQTIQMHGTHSDRVAPFPYRLIPAFAVRDATSLQEIRRYLDSCRTAEAMPAAILLDAYVPGQYGGTGKTAPWDVLAEFQPGVPVILAGGLTAENVAEAVRRVRPYAVDVASGVESAPGRKDPEKVRRFIANAKEAAVKFPS